jgi:hypothetical protein
MHLSDFVAKPLELYGLRIFHILADINIREEAI